jgi:hypothetical protein
MTDRESSRRTVNTSASALTHGQGLGSGRVDRPDGKIRRQPGGGSEDAPTRIDSFVISRHTLGQSPRTCGRSRVTAPAVIGDDLPWCSW